MLAMYPTLSWTHFRCAVGLGTPSAAHEALCQAGDADWSTDRFAHEVNAMKAVQKSRSVQDEQPTSTSRLETPPTEQSEETPPQVSSATFTVTHIAGVELTLMADLDSYKFLDDLTPGDLVTVSFSRKE